MTTNSFPSLTKFYSIIIPQLIRSAEVQRVVMGWLVVKVELGLVILHVDSDIIRLQKFSYWDFLVEIKRDFCIELAAEEEHDQIFVGSDVFFDEVWKCFNRIHFVEFLGKVKKMPVLVLEEEFNVDLVVLLFEFILQSLYLSLKK